jgi:hypothetical protein
MPSGLLHRTARGDFRRPSGTVLCRCQAGPGVSNFASSFSAAARPVLQQEPSITAECYEKMNIVDLGGMQPVNLDNQRGWVVPDS